MAKKAISIIKLRSTIVRDLGIDGGLARVHGDREHNAAFFVKDFAFIAGLTPDGEPHIVSRVPPDLMVKSLRWLADMTEENITEDQYINPTDWSPTGKKE